MKFTFSAVMALSFVLAVACKQPSKGQKASSQNATKLENVEDAEDPATAGAPAPSETEAEFPKVSSELIGRAEEIHTAIQAALEKKHPSENGSVWSAARMQLSGDWVVESPEGLWGLDASELPKELDCDPKKDQACHADFKRMACESDSDCTAVGTHCAPLEATIFKPGQEAQKLCLGPSDKLIDRFYSVMASAEKELDIVSLSMPDGRFRVAMNHALAYLSQKQTPPSVRLLFSGYTPVSLNIFFPPSKVLGDIMKDLEKLSSSAHALPMNLAWMADGKVSWNHAKIIVADGNNAISGGHNMWDNDYLRPSPISDLSLQFSGEAAEKARDFINTMWSKVEKYATSDMIFGRLPEYKEKAPSTLGFSAIHVGRMGSAGANPADDAIIAMLKSAKKSAMIDQQDYFNVAVSNSDLTRSFAFGEIIETAVRGVKVSLVHSNKYPLGNYGMVDPAKAYENFIGALTKRLQEAKTLTKDAARKRACELMVMAPFRINGKLKEWPNGGGVFGSHTKLVMIDEAAVYVGSQNLYPANLQEYGSIITDAAATAKFKEIYWDKLWNESSQALLPCPK